MIKTKTQEMSVEIVEAKVCDVCGLECEPDEFDDFDEFFHIRSEGGYNSIFGDGTTISCDVCQHCVKKILGQYLTVEESGNGLQ